MLQSIFEVEQTGPNENEFLMHSVKAATWCCFKVIKLECGFKVANRHFISNVMRIKLFSPYLGIFVVKLCLEKYEKQKLKWATKGWTIIMRQHGWHGKCYICSGLIYIRLFVSCIHLIFTFVAA